MSRDISAPADHVWSLVSDLPRMGEWSNENFGGEWLDDADGPEVGARFRGTNRNGIRRWRTLVTVLEADAGERFTFRVSYMRIPVSEWSYLLEPTDGGCRATESWTDRRPGWFRPLGYLASGVGDRAQHTQMGMALTLERLAAAAEDPRA